MIFPGNPTQSLIIEYIATKKFCNAKEIYAAINKYCNNKISIQSIYKSLNTLIANNVIVKHNKYYTFCLDFLDNINQFSSKIRESANELNNLHNILTNIDRRGKISFRTNTVWERVQIYITIINSIMYSKSFKGDVYRTMYHYGCFLFPEEQSFLSNVRKEVKMHDYVYGLTEIDKLAARSLKGENHKVNLLGNIPQRSRHLLYYICSPYILTFEHEDISAYKHTEFLNKQKCSKESLSQFYHFYQYEYLPSTITIEKNKMKAEMKIAEIQRLKEF